MKLGKERKIKYAEFDVDFSDEEFQKLKEFGLKRIVEDDKSLVNYAVNILLSDYIERQKELNYTKKFSKSKIIKERLKRNAN